MRVAIVQFEAGPHKAENVDKAEERIRQAAAEGADVAVLPEIWNVGYFAFDRYEDGAELIDGPTMTRLQTIAAELEIHLHTGSIVERSGDALYNTSGLIDPSGELLDTYRKIHLFGYESQESQLLTPGERVVAIDTQLGTVGLTTCYDLRFPELYRALADADVEMLLITSAWPNARLEHWLLLNRVRALENQVYLAAANLTGSNNGVELAGQSLVVDPWGVPIANAGTSERTATASVDLAAIGKTRGDFPAFADRQLELAYEF